MNRKKIIMAHGIWGTGGAEIAAMHLIEVLKNDFELHIITRGGWNLKKLNEIAGTEIKSKEICLVDLPFSTLLSKNKGGSIWNAFFVRYCRSIANNFDIRITLSQTMGWGKPSIHFLTDVVWNDRLAEKFEKNNNQKSYLKKVLKLLGTIIAGKAKYQLNKDDIFIANSKWTASISEEYTTNKPQVIYPPVVNNFIYIPWNKKSEEFVILGRISPEKNIKMAIKIIKNLRLLGFNLKLNIIGEFKNDGYSNHIKKIIKSFNWIKCHGYLQFDKKIRILPKFKYGINCCERESFGISTAEMLSAGIIPFVPAKGAQSEIVKYKEILFSDEKDAVKKISTILSSNEIKNSLNEKLNLENRDFKKKFDAQIIKLFKKYE